MRLHEIRRKAIEMATMRDAIASRQKRADMRTVKKPTIGSLQMRWFNPIHRSAERPRNLLSHRMANFQQPYEYARIGKENIPSEYYMRVHRSVIVNLRRIEIVNAPGISIRQTLHPPSPDQNRENF